MYPDHVGRVCGSIAMSLSLGMICGSPFGSLLFTLGGFKLPYLVAGALQVVLGPLAYIVITQSLCSDEETKTSSHKSLQAVEITDKYEKVTDPLLPQNSKTLKKSSISWYYAIKEHYYVIFISAVASVTSSSIGFFFVAFAPHLLIDFGVGNNLSGPLFLPFTVIRALTAPVFGFFTDKGYGGLIFCLFGCGFSLTGFAILGISDCIPMLDKLTSFEAIVGFIAISSTGTLVPLVFLLRSLYRKNSSIENDETIALYASAVYLACFDFGKIIGQSITGGYILDLLGFYNSCRIQVALSSLSLFLALSCILRNDLLIARNV